MFSRGRAGRGEDRSHGTEAIILSRRTVVLDDDPTGSQEATNVPVILGHDARGIVAALSEHPTVYLITNSRSLDERAAVDLHESISRTLTTVAERNGSSISVVLRGDSTLRGHVFAESAVFETEGSLLVLCPAFPAGGRRTHDGVHELWTEGSWVNVADTEFARDPVFGFTARDMVSYVHEKSGREAVLVRASTLDEVASTARPAVVVVEASTDAELAGVASTIRDLEQRGTPCVVRCAAPLAAYLGGVKSTGLLTLPPAPSPILVVVGSHTAGARAQLASVTQRYGEPTIVSTTTALDDPEAAAGEAAARLRDTLTSHPVAVLATERDRHPGHWTLDHGARVMQALSSTVRRVADIPGAVISKGGITSYDVARRGFGARCAWVEGQVLPGISSWRIRRSGRTLPFVVVPGNMGAADAILRLVEMLVGASGEQGCRMEPAV